tara:strand:+ start:461 stop:634 length:174 start_codon:yes stop_codon:yes gene_type:complete
MGKKGEFHRILVDGKVIFDNLGQGEFFERMEDLSIQYYQTGSPHPNTISTQIIMEDN